MSIKAGVMQIFVTFETGEISILSKNFKFPISEEKYIELEGFLSGSLLNIEGFSFLEVLMNLRGQKL